jgi:cytosine/adenosine deaminase-related metal-dependent hydrolase
LTLSEAGVVVKYNVYLSEKAIKLRFASSDRSRVELAALLLRHAGVSAEVKKEGGRDVWYIEVTTDKLAAGRVELRNALAEVVRGALARGWVDANKAERWLEELEKGRVLKEGWQEYEVGLSSSGALVVRYRSTNSDSIKQGAQRFREMGLEEGRHFSMKMPEEGREGYVYIRREGLAYAAWLSEHGSGR